MDKVVEEMLTENNKVDATATQSPCSEEGFSRTAVKTVWQDELYEQYLGDALG